MLDGLYLYSTGPRERRDAHGSAVLTNGRIYAFSEGQVFSGTFDIVGHRMKGQAILVYELDYGPVAQRHIVSFIGVEDQGSIVMDCIPNGNDAELYSAVLKRID